MTVARRTMLRSERDALAFSFEHKCAACKALLQPGWHADHVIALADGGDDTMANVQPLCAPCHTVKTARENSGRPRKGRAEEEPAILVGLMGLPSAGKSTAVNALIGMRVRQSGVCRTTNDVFLVARERRERVFRALGLDALGLGALGSARHELTSDDGVAFDVLDFPGVADSEETDASPFDACVAQCDVICWVSDIRTSFMTVHETAEFKRARDALEASATKTGRLYQYCIVLTKYDFDDTSVPRAPVRVERGEIAEPEEETTVTDCLARVRRLFPDTRICKFNAFGRIAYGQASDALRALLSRMAPPRNVNTSFELRWALDGLALRRQMRLLDAMLAVPYARGKDHLTANVRSLTEPEALRALFERVVLEGRTCIAHQIGVMPALAPIAALVEPTIAPNAESLSCLLALLGPNDAVYTRTYLRAARAEPQSSVRQCVVFGACACRAYTFAAPASLARLEPMHPAIFELDVATAYTRAYGARVREARAQLWGADDACWRMLVTGTWLKRIASVLSPLPQTDPG
jgi:hypothetical protein